MKSTKTKEPPRAPRELLDELKALVGEAQAILSNSVSEHSTDTLNNLRERFNATQERVTEVYDEGKKKVVAGARDTDTAIREHPYQSLAITLGVGMLLGVLLGRRSN